MFCGYCGKQLDDRAKFCPYCGKQTQMTHTPGGSPDDVQADPVSAPQPSAYNGPAQQPTAYNGPVPQPTAYNGPAPQPTAYNGPAPQPTAYNGPAPQPTAYNGPAPQPTAYNGPAPQPSGYNGPAPQPSGKGNPVSAITDKLSHVKLPSGGAAGGTAAGAVSSEMITKVSRIVAAAACVILVLSGFLPYLKPNQNAEMLSGWAGLAGVSGIEPLKLTSEDLLPFWIVLVILSVVIVVSIVMKISIMQIVVSIITIMGSILIVFIMSSYMDDSRVRSVYEYGSGSKLFAFGAFVLFVSIIMAIVGIATKKNVPPARVYHEPR